MRLLWPIAVAVLSIGAALWRGVDLGAFVLLVLLSATLLANLPDLLKFSIGPLSAEFRERVAEARQILDALKQQSGVLAGPLLDVLAWSNRMGAMTVRRRQDLMLSVSAELARQGFSESEVSDLLTTYKRLVGMDYSRFILGDRGPKGVAESQAKEWGVLRSPVEPQPPQRLREFLGSIDALGEETEALLRDYEAFLQTGQIGNVRFLDAKQDGVRFHLERGVGLVEDAS